MAGAVPRALLTALTGSMQVAWNGQYNLSWSVNDPKVEFTLTWEGSDWAAFGLHHKPGMGMNLAEIFMCHHTPSMGSGCEVRSSARGYIEPAILKQQYIHTVKVEQVGERKTAVFTRDLSVAKEVAASVTVDITNKTLGMIYARGVWGSDGHPMQHEGTAGRWQVNFLTQGRQPGPPAPAPPAPPAPTPRAGVWPVRLDARMTIAPSQVPTPMLKVKLGSRLRYDFPGRRQRWEYWDVEDPTETATFAETWINETLYELDLTTNPPGCSAYAFKLEVLRPDWLVHTTYLTSQYTARQPPPQPSKKGVCYTPYSELTELYQDPAPIGGITNNWIAFNSSIGEPVRLEGPDDFTHPTWLTIQDYLSFHAVEEHDAHTFDIPEGCKPPSPDEIAAAPFVKRPPLGRMRPHVSDAFERVMELKARMEAQGKPSYV